PSCSILIWVIVTPIGSHLPPGFARVLMPRAPELKHTAPGRGFRPEGKADPAAPTLAGLRKGSNTAIGSKDRPGANVGGRCEPGEIVPGGPSPDSPKSDR